RKKRETSTGNTQSHQSRRTGETAVPPQSTRARAPAPTTLLLIYVRVLGVDYAFVFLGFTVAAGLLAASAATRPSASARRRCLRLRRLVHLLGKLVRSLRQSLPRAVHLRFVVRLEYLLRIGDCVFHVSAVGAGNFVSLLLQHLLNLINH